MCNCGKCKTCRHRLYMRQYRIEHSINYIRHKHFYENAFKIELGSIVRKLNATARTGNKVTSETNY